MNKKEQWEKEFDELFPNPVKKGSNFAHFEFDSPLREHYENEAKKAKNFISNLLKKTDQTAYEGVYQEGYAIGTDDDRERIIEEVEKLYDSNGDSWKHCYKDTLQDIIKIIKDEK